MSEENWIEVGSTDSIEEEDLIRFDHQDKTFCVYKLTDGFYATDGICTHEAVHLEDGLVMDDEIECPMHQGIFNIKSGEALSPPACEDLKTYPVKVDNGKIIAQGATTISKEYSIEKIAKKILKIEHNLYPTAIAKLLKKNVENNEKKFILSYYE